MSSAARALLTQATPGLARFAISEAAIEARKGLPATHPARLIDTNPHTSPDAADEALARAWFTHLAGLEKESEE